MALPPKLEITDEASIYRTSSYYISGKMRMPKEHRFTIHLLPEPEGGFTVRVPALPPVITYGETREEALANAKEAIEAVLEVYLEDGEEIPEDVAPIVHMLTVAA